MNGTKSLLVIGLVLATELRQEGRFQSPAWFPIGSTQGHAFRHR